MRALGFLPQLILLCSLTWKLKAGQHSFSPKIFGHSLNLGSKHFLIETEDSPRQLGLEHGEDYQRVHINILSSQEALFTDS